MTGSLRRVATNVVAELFAVLRLAFTLRLDPSAIVGRDAAIALLGAIALALWLLLNWWSVDGPVKFEASALADIAAVAAVALGLALLTSRLGSPALPFRQTLWLVAGYLPAAAVAAFLLHAPLSRPILVAAGIGIVVHAALYFFFGLRALGARSQWRGFSALAIGVAGVIALNQHAPMDTRVWSPRQNPTEIAAYLQSRQRTEELMYAQAERIDEALSAVTLTPASRPSMYFLGFAGFGEQKVFTEEVELAARRIHERYGTNGRRVILANDSRDFDEYPFATISALRRVLQGIAQRMDPERDVLFVALSSHGKRDPKLVVSNGALPLDHLTGEDLARILRESGIRWKVLVISACYAGAFIPHLKDDDTIVITAAAPDKTSFGCNDKRELTYFGEAFYRDALPSAKSLRTAFDTAIADIAARERRLGLEPSNPQGHFGAAVEEKLGELDALRLSAAQ